VSGDEEASAANASANDPGKERADARHIFVCYSHQDAKLVYDDLDWLRAAGCRVWIDQNLQPGTIWRGELATAIEEAAAVLFYVSPSSVASAHCNREVNYALDRNVPILPVYLADAELCPDLRIGLSRVQAIHRRGLAPDDYRARLLSALRREKQAPEAPAAPPKSHRSRRIAAAAAGLVVAGAALATALYFGARDRGRESNANAAMTSFAVMPFENVGGDPDEQYFVDGVTDEVTSEIASIAGLRVVPWSSTRLFQKDRLAVADISAKLGVEGVLEGSVRRTADALSIGLRLVRAKDERLVWENEYRGAITDIPTLEKNIVRGLAQALDLPLPEQSAPAQDANRVVPEVYELYLRGRFFWNKRDEDSLNKAVEYFGAATERDPAFAPAFAGLADAYLTMFDYEVADRHEATAKAREAVRKALEIDDKLGEAHNSLAHLHLHDWNWAEAKREFQRAVALDPDNASSFHWYALCLTALGETDRAVETMLIAQRLDPLSVRINTDLGMAYYAAGRYDEAIAQETKMLELDPGFRPAFWIRGMAYEGKGDYPKAIGEFREALNIAPDNPNALGALGHALALSGDEAGAREIASDLEARIDKGVSPFVIALVYAGLSDVEQTFAWLERAYEKRDGSVRYLKSDPRLANLRGDPRFTDLMRRVGLDSAPADSIDPG
jgi:TolB-like protein/Tfp pilus assembly protein PilF